jgi:hypothetical protein
MDTERTKDQVEFLVVSMGTAVGLAELLGVSLQDLIDWLGGRSEPEPLMAAKLSDLESVVKIAQLQWSVETARTWMTSPNSRLDGATPAATVIGGGVARVMLVLEDMMAGGFG